MPIMMLLPQVKVRGAHVPMGPQPFSIAMSGPHRPLRCLLAYPQDFSIRKLSKADQTVRHFQLQVLHPRIGNQGPCVHCLDAESQFPPAGEEEYYPYGRIIGGTGKRTSHSRTHTYVLQWELAFFFSCSVSACASDSCLDDRPLVRCRPRSRLVP